MQLDSNRFEAEMFELDTDPVGGAVTCGCAVIASENLG